MSTPETNTKDRIRQKANDLYMKFGIRSISMDDIANALGMSKKTIYQYFSDKNELVDAVVIAELADMVIDCDQCAANAQDAIHEIFLTMEKIIGQITNMNPVVMNDLQKYHTTVFERFQKHKTEYLYHILVENMNRGIREGLFREGVNTDIIAKFRLECIMMSFNLDVFPPGKYSLVDVTMEILEHYVFGLANAEGNNLILKYKYERQKAKQYDTLPGSKAK